ncbi:MAG: hypothetical protein RLZZ263_342 [Cyanobacteriota bacterium]|jgi:hypothetical protein
MASLGLACLGLASWAGVGAGWVRPAQAEPATGTGQSYGNPQLQRELDYGTGKTDGGSLFNSANPIDLMNKLRKATAMDDATSPQDAVDAALKGLDAPVAAKPSGASASVPQDAVDAALKGLDASSVAKPSGASASVKAP